MYFSPQIFYGGCTGTDRVHTQVVQNSSLKTLPTISEKEIFLTCSSSIYIFYHLLHNSFEETAWKVHFQIYENQEHFAKLKRGESFKLVRLGLTGWITLISNNSNSAQNGADFIWYPEMFIFGYFLKRNFQNYTIWNKSNLGKDQRLTHNETSYFRLDYCLTMRQMIWGSAIPWHRIWE